MVRGLVLLPSSPAHLKRSSLQRDAAAHASSQRRCRTPCLQLPQHASTRHAVTQHAQEDAHAISLDVDGETRTALFGVFDGHAGSEAAAFCARHIVRARVCVLSTGCAARNRLPASQHVPSKQRDGLLCQQTAAGIALLTPSQDTQRTHAHTNMHAQVPVLIQMPSYKAGDLEAALSEVMPPMSHSRWIH